MYRVFLTGQTQPTAVLKTNDKGMANVTAVGPMREAVRGLAAKAAEQSRIFVMDGEEAPDAAKAVLTSPESNNLFLLWGCPCKTGRNQGHPFFFAVSLLMFITQEACQGGDLRKKPGRTPPFTVLTFWKTT